MMMKAAMMRNDARDKTAYNRLTSSPQGRANYWRHIFMGAPEREMQGHMLGLTS